MGLKQKFLTGMAVSAVLTLSAALAHSADKPNILVIWGDDIGQSDISAYTHGLMGFETPNIDRISEEGCLKTPFPVLQKRAKKYTMKFIRGGYFRLSQIDQEHLHVEFLTIQ